MNHRFLKSSNKSIVSTGTVLTPDKGFTLVELLVVLGIMAIILAIVSPLVPSLLRANQFDSNVNTLAGVLEEAREAATAGNTYIWVAFTDPPAGSPGTGIWVTTISSQDGTETGINSGTATAPNWTQTLAFPATNFLLHSKVQNLPGVEVIMDPASIAGAPTLATINTNISTSASAKTPPGPIPPVYTSPTSGTATSLQGSLTWTVQTPTSTGASTLTFAHALEFTPNGEAHVQNWSVNIQFGVAPSVGKTTNSALFNISRLTGKTTVYRM